MREVYSAQDIQKAIDRIDRRLQLIQGRRAQKIVARVNGRPVLHTQLQMLFNMKFDDVVDRRVYELIMTHAASAEKLGPGGFSRFLSLLHDHLDGSREGSSSCSPRHATVEQVEALVERYGSQGGPRTIAMLKEAIRLAGFSGRIIVEKTSSTTPSVELVRGYTFELQQLLPVDFSFVRPRVTCIDGYIEEVAEIHHLLEAAAEAKEPCILFLRGMSDDVKHTLKVNYDRGSLRVVPIGVRFDLEGMNTLVDLATVTGADLISSLKGDLISSIKFNELPCVDQVTMLRGRVVVVSSKKSKAVKDHVSNLRKRRAEERVDDVASLLDKRIKSLSPNHVVIRLPDDKDFVINSQSIDYALRAARSAIDNGVNDDGELVTTELAAGYHARRCARTLREVGAYLT